MSNGESKAERMAEALYWVIRRSGTKYAARFPYFEGFLSSGGGTFWAPTRTKAKRYDSAQEARSVIARMGLKGQTAHIVRVVPKRDCVPKVVLPFQEADALARAFLGDRFDYHIAGQALAKIMKVRMDLEQC